MKKFLILTIALTTLAINIPTYAKGGRSGYSSSKSYGSSSRSRSSRYYGGYSYPSSSTDNSSYSGSYSKPIEDAQLVSVASLHTSQTIRKAGLRTCAVKACTVVTYLPKGSKVKWSESNNGYAHIDDTPYWISSLDIK